MPNITENKHPLILALAALAAGALTLVCLEDQPRSSNPATRFGSAVERVERGTWSLDASPFLWSHDKIFRDGHFYSSKPPALEWLAAGLVGALRMAGLSFEDAPVLVYRFVVFWLAFLPFAAVVALTWVMTRHEPWGWTAPLCAGVASLLWPLSVTLTNHPLTALLVLAGLWLARRRSLSVARATAAGAVTGAVALFEIGMGMAWPLVMAPLVWVGAEGRWQQKARPLAGFLVALACCWALGAALNVQRHGSPLPPYVHSEWYDYEGSVFHGADLGPKPYSRPLPRLFHLTVGHYGVFVMTPVLLFAFHGAVGVARRRPRRLEPALVAGGAALMLLGIALNTSERGMDLGGGSYGLRWFTALVAPLSLYVPASIQALQGAARWWRWAFAVAVGWSVAVAAVGVTVSPWPHNSLSPWPTVDALCSLALRTTAPPHPVVAVAIDATSVDPGLSWHDVGVIYLRRGYPAEAAEALGRALEHDDRRDETWYFLGQALEQSGRPAEAETVLQTLLERRPEHAGALSLMGVVLTRAGRPLDALTLYDRLLEANPDHVSALNNSALILSKLGLNDVALARYERSFALAPDNLEALHNQALLLEKMGRVAQALAVAERLVEVHGDSPERMALRDRLAGRLAEETLAPAP